MAVLDLKTSHQLSISSDFGKDVTVTLSGFDALDTGYTLTMTNGAGVSVNLSVGSGITLGSLEMTIAFNASDFTAAGQYTGTLSSASSAANVFLRIDMSLDLC